VIVAGEELVRDGQLVRPVGDDLTTVRAAAADLKRFADM